MLPVGAHLRNDRNAAVCASNSGMTSVWSIVISRRKSLIAAGAVKGLSTASWQTADLICGYCSIILGEVNVP
jgi:hypothetical protein